MQQEMEYIYTVYQKGSFSKAAEALFMTQPALSISIQKVENEIGMPLFNRDKKPLELTEAGQLYIEKIRQIMHLENELSQQLNDLTDLKTGQLRIGGSHYFNSYILPPVIADFKKKWPGIDLELTEAGSYELLTMLKDDLIDLTFNCTPDPHDKLRRIPGFQDTILLAVSTRFPANNCLTDAALTTSDILSRRYQDSDCPAVTMEAFADTPFILLSPGNNLYSRSQSFFQEAGVNPPTAMQVSQLVTAYHLAQAGIGATLISDWMVTGKHPEMIYYKIASPLAGRIFDIVTPGKNYLSNAQQAFISLFRKYYKTSFYP